MNFRVLIIFHFNSGRIYGKNYKYIFFILTCPIGGYIYYMDFHNTRYRKSYICFYKIGIGLLSMSTTTSLFIPWYGVGIIEILAKRLKISERIEEYKSIYNFYRELLHL
jgi:hypothetical protein